jgi:hypothetical protein
MLKVMEQCNDSQRPVGNNVIAQWLSNLVAGSWLRQALELPTAGTDRALLNSVLLEICGLLPYCGKRMV